MILMWLWGFWPMETDQKYEEFLVSNNNWIDEIEEPRADMSGNTKKTNRLKKIGGQGQEKYLLWGGGGLILILLLILLFRGCGASPQSDIRELKSRLALLEDKLVSLQSDQVEQQAVREEFDRSEDFQVLVHRLDTLSKKLQSLEKKMQAAESSAAVQEQAVEETASPSDSAFLQEATYTVQPGDTLYSISRKYNVSVTELRKWNDLGQEGVIHPGQTLQIAPKPEQ